MVTFRFRRILLPAALLSVFVIEQAWSLNNPARPAKKPLERIAVIGAGISGLSVAHALTNSKGFLQRATDPFQLKVSIFDARPSLDTKAGAGIQLNGGLAVLGMINPTLQQAVREAGIPQSRVRSRCKSWFANDASFDTLFELDLKKIVAAASDEVSQSLIARDGQLQWISIMRGALQESLLENLPRGTDVQFKKSLSSIRERCDGGIECIFADGSVEGPFDLVIGCDGIKSPVKAFVNKRVDKDESRNTDSSTIYSGLRIRYAVSDGDSSRPVEPTATLTQYFGNGAYALHGVYGAGKGRPSTRCAFIVFLDDAYVGPFPKQRRDAGQTLQQEPEPASENVDWSQDVRKNVEVARANMIKQMQACSIPDRDKELSDTIAQADRFFELGSYFHNPFTSWSREVDGSKGAYVALCGDSAHALPPFLGQGSNQAIQDAYCLASKLYDYNRLVSSGEAAADLGRHLKEYEQTRWPSTFSIFWKSAFLGYLETGGFDGFYSKFRDVFFKSMGLVGVAQRVLLNAAVPKI